MSKCQKCKHVEYGDTIFYSVCGNAESSNHSCMVYSSDGYDNVDWIHIDGCELFESEECFKNE